ncbi:MAG: methylmalonyl-CoA mutase [Desulfobacteraceae bacterium]|nr:MAG: methylmalonyl-CoA mutase [Desulfobacteraceae bacterium]
MGNPDKNLQENVRRWTEASLGKQGFSPRSTDWGEPLKPLYTPDDLSGQDYLETIGFPGEYPFVRGIHPTMYLGRTWTMRQYSGFGTAEETNRRYRYLLGQGQTGLSVAFDLPTQIGYDSDHPMSEGEVGKVGVAVDSLLDMEILFRDLPLDRLSTSMTINAPAAILLAMYIAVAEKRSIPSRKLRGTIQNDILKEYAARGTYIFPPKPSIRLITDIFGFCTREVPLWNTVNVGGYHLREAGCSAVQEIAFAFSNAVAYIEAALSAGQDIDSFAPRISWIFNTHNKIFEEVAKYRAARKVWADILRYRFKAKDPRSWMLRFHTQTSGVSLMAQQPENNIVRVAYQALAAVLGGAQSLAVCSYDEALAIPTEKSVRLSLRTQQILEHEAGVTDTVDPLGGSYYVESLTGKMVEEIQTLIAKVDEMGGAVAAVEKGFIQREIESRAYAFQKEVEQKKRIVVGVNEFRMEEHLDVSLFKSDPEVVKKQVARVQEVRRTRDQANCRASLESVRKAAVDGGNLMPHLVEAVKAYATLGEICDVLREVFGEYRPVQ